jgi:hypothetical protein
MQEIWKDIPNYEGMYQVSNLGNFKSCDRIVTFNKVKALKKGRTLKLRESKDGYLYTVFSVNSERKTIKPHRIVACVFIPNSENKPCVNHINGIKNDNRVENLEWVTYSENTIHAVKIGLKKGKRNGTSHFCKLNQKQVNQIKKIYLKGNISQLELSKKFNISQTQVSRICRGVNWI